MEEVYEYTTRTWDMLVERSIDWQAVDFVLRHANPVVRRHIGSSVLRITGMDLAYRWLMVTLVELPGRDDQYEIYDARYLNEDETKLADTATQE